MIDELDWRIYPFPDGREFGFTIVHDADDAYRERLGPLFEVFDSLKFKLTVTAFAFWAEWADNGSIWDQWREADRFSVARCVPLEDPQELEFYQSLAESGHEIGLHTASDTDDTRIRIIEAFEFFNEKFGHFPTTYVEHRDNLQNHQINGAQPDSDYFITDVLNQYEPWVWIVSPSAIPYDGYGEFYDLLSSQLPFGLTFPPRLWGTLKHFIKTNRWSVAEGRLFELMLAGGTPFDHYARQKYGLLKTFRRSGRQQNAGGDGFLDWYSPENIDRLIANNGLAIVYTHLNTGWLDPRTKRLRRDIESRLESISSRNGWFATASEILDRFDLLSRVVISYHDDWIKIANGADKPIDGLTLVSQMGTALHRGNLRIVQNCRRFVVGKVDVGETLTFRVEM